MPSKSKKTIADTLKGDSKVDETVLEGTNVGEIFQKAREKEGLTLAMVSKELMIRKFYLSALEDGRYHELPSNVYAFGFVKSYSEYLGLETETLVEQFRRERGGAVQKTELVFPEMVTESKVPSRGVVLGGAVVALVVLFVGASILGEDTANELETIPEPAKISTDTLVEIAPVVEVETPVSDDIKTVESVSVDEDVPTVPAFDSVDGITAPRSDAINQEAQIIIQGDGQATEAVLVQEPVPTEPLSNEIVEKQDVVKEIPSVKIGEVLSSNAVETAPEPEKVVVPVQINEDSAVKSRITVSSVSESWVEIRDKNGVLLLTRVLQPGQRYDVPDEKGITMITGNAGGVYLIVDGKEMPPLGKPATVKRNIKLDAELY